MDPTVSLARRVPHLGYEQLPPLADYDHTKNLVKIGFPHLDPLSGSRPRHMIWGILHIYRTCLILSHAHGE